jgi:hypothetical protein
MTTNFIKLNEDKTELFFINARKIPLSLTLNIGSVVVSPSQSARSLGVIFDSKLNFEKQIASIILLNHVLILFVQFPV